MADADKAEAAQSPSAYVGQPEASAGASAGAWGGAPGPAHLQRQVSDTGDGRNFSSFLKAGDMDSRGVGMMSAPTAMRLQVNEGIRMKGEAKAKAGGGEGEGGGGATHGDASSSSPKRLRRGAPKDRDRGAT